MGKFNRSANLVNFKYSLLSALKEKKWKLFISIIISVIAIFTGVFIAIKYNNSERLASLQEISLDKFLSGFAGSSSAFFSRTISLCINSVLLFVFSFSPLLFPLAQVLFAYRGYLFGLNFALVFIMYGLGGSLTAIVVILPCQLLTIAALIVFYLLLTHFNSCAKKYGRASYNRILFLIIGFAVLVLINLV